MEEKLNFAFMLFRGLDVNITFAQSMSCQFQAGLSVSKALWPVSRKDIQAPQPSHTSWEESVFSARACAESPSRLC